MGCLTLDFGMDLRDSFCPNESCPMYGGVGEGNIWRHTSYGREHDRRRFVCKVCGRTFSETRGTVFYKLRTPREKVLQALAMLVERGSIRGTARAMGVSKDTVSRWLGRAAEHSEEVSQHLMRDLHLTQVQVDEIWSFIQKRGKGTRGLGPPWKRRPSSS